jgi:hypothetical protein
MILIAFLMSSVLSDSAIEVSGPSPSHVGAYGIVEFHVDAGRRYSNPFDPQQIAVDGTFRSSGGRQLVLPGFWDGTGFRFRFCPPEGGDWSLVTSISDDQGKRHAPARSFHVADSSGGGFVRTSDRNHRYFQLDSGKTFMPIGLNLCWPGGAGLASYDERFAKLQSVGGNFARIWCTQDKRLETEEAGLGRYDQSSAAYYDEVLKLAQKHEIRIMLTLDDYRVLAKTDYFVAHWKESPYNSANGGPLHDPGEFFANDLCRKLYKQRLRYLVARYSAFPSLAFWEIFNEQDNIPKPGVPIDWFREMTGYLASIDPYHHLITTSYSWDDKPEVWRSPSLGLTQRHMYGQGDTVDFVTMIEDNSRKLDRFDKPRLIGEFGITWKEPDIALDKGKKGTPLHDALWASIMTGDAGGALTWWWDNYLEPLDLWPVYVGISRFVSGIDFSHRDFRPVPLEVKGVTALGMQDARSGETIFWLHDPQSNWKSDAEGESPREWSRCQVSLPLERPATAEVWDTRTGEIVARERLVPSAGACTMLLPPFYRDVAVRVKGE